MADPSEPLRSLPTPLLWDVVSEIESDRDLSNEFFSARLEAIVQVAVRVVEQERGLELQVNCPESTLATMLPIVIEIESDSVLNREFFSVSEDAKFSEPVSALKRELCLTKEDARPRESLRNLKIEFFSARPEPRVRVSLRP